MKEKIPSIKLEENLIQNMHLKESLDFFKKLISQLFLDIKNHKYDIIIGDDISGRIPTLIIGGLMKLIYLQDKTKPLNILFLAGFRMSSDKKNENLKKYFDYLIKNKKIHKNSKILLVTEDMETGTTIKYFADFLNKNKLDFSVASLLTLQDNYNFLNKKSHFDQLYIGGKSNETNTNLYQMMPYLFRKEIGKIFSEKSEWFNKKEYHDHYKMIQKDIKTMVKILKKYYDELLKNS